MLTHFDLAQRFIGTREVTGAASNPMVLAMLRLDGTWAQGDDVPWCSAFVNYIAWLCRLPRSKSLRARSWLHVGLPVPLARAQVGDVVILNRGGPADPTVIEAPGHVGFFAALEGDRVQVLGGNQSDSVSVASFPVPDVLGVRRIA